MLEELTREQRLALARARAAERVLERRRRFFRTHHELMRRQQRPLTPGQVAVVRLEAELLLDVEQGRAANV